MTKSALHNAASALTFAIVLLTSGPGTLMGAPVLPKLGFSVPADANMQEIRETVTRSGLREPVLILPPTRIVLGDNQSQGGPFDAYGQILRSVPEGSLVFLRLVIEAGASARGGREQEKAVTDMISDLLSRLPVRDPSVRGLLVEIRGPAPSLQLLQFALANLAVKGKALKNSLQTVLTYPAGFVGQNADLIRRLSSYFDALGTVYTSRWHEDLAWVAEHALNKPVFLKLETEGTSSPERIAVSYLDRALVTSGTAADVIWVEQPDTKTLDRLCTATALLSRHIKTEYVPVPSQQSPFIVAAAGSEAGDSRIYSDPQARSYAIVHRQRQDENPVSVQLRGPSAGQFEIKWYEVITGRPLQPAELRREEGRLVQDCEVGPGYALLLIRNLAPPDQQLHSAVEVTARADLTLEEIIARWQQYKESQRQGLGNYTADCLMNLHFENIGFGSGFDVAMDFKQFWNREGLVEWVQSGLYVNGVKMKSRWEFPLPQLEPEKVMTPPLELKLNEKYAYRLLGTDQVDGQYCYVVGVEPKAQNETLYSGQIWIDGTSFRQVRMELRQRGKDSNAIGNVETQDFTLVPDGKGNQFNLLRSIYAQQTLNAAGRNVIVERRYRFSQYMINAADFEPSLSSARLSDSPIYRDTETGLQEFRKEGDKRVLIDRNKSVKSLIGGALYDGAFDFPVPLFGLSLVDFNYRKTGSQLSVFFAGPILAANLSKQYKSRYRLGADLALSALPENNRIYQGDTEVEKESLWIFEESAGLRGSWQATPDLSLTGSFYFAYNYYCTVDTTDEAYVTPRNGITLLPSVELKYARSGYVVTAGGTYGNRIGWREFGIPGQPARPVRSQFDKYFAGFTKSFYFGKFQKTMIDLGYYSGDRMDRFSRYRPSFLSRPRIRGIPSGTDSFDNVGVASVSHGFNVMDFIKFEGVYTHAWGRNKDESNHFREFDGLEFDFGTAGPWGTYMQGIVNYALTGNIDRYNSRWGFYFLIFRPFR